MWDYSEKVLDHYRNPRNVGSIENADAIGEAGSLACGDSLKIYLKIENNIVVDAKFQTFGCGSAVASSSILTEMVIGKTLDEVKQITNQDIADELDGLPPEKMHCSVMGHEALEDALKNYFREEKKSSDKIICTCFGVTEKQIIDAVKENGLKTVEEVTNYTKAGGACGRCKGIIASIIESCTKNLQEETQMTSTQFVLKVNKIIETLIAPELQKDGGDIELIDIQGHKVMVKLYGRCSACKNSLITLKNFVETTLKDKINPQIEVVQI